MPYTIVLTPQTDQAYKYIDASQDLYKDCQPSYLLNHDGTSSPHITVVQFNAESLETAKKVWKSICEKLSKENLSSFKPPFTGLSFVEGTGPYENTTWVELSIKRGDENSPIMKIHHAAIEALKEFDIKPLNACGNDYRPHLTLARIVMPKELKPWPKSLIENGCDFNLEFGLSDDKWQYAKKLGTLI